MRILRVNLLFWTILGLSVCTQSAMADTVSGGSSSSSSSSFSSSYSTSSSNSAFKLVEMKMRVSGVSAEHGVYTVKEISYGDVEAFDWESGLYGSSLLDSAAYTANIEYSGSDAIITLSLPAFLAGHNSVTVIAGYANAPTLCSDYFEVSGNFRNAVATFEKGATADETVEGWSKAAGCLQEGITVTLKNETKREFSKNRPTAPNNDPDTILKYYKTYLEWNEKINKYLSSIGLTQTQIDNLCKENGCNRNSYMGGFNCNKEKLIWVRDGAPGKTTSKWKLSGDCICIDEIYPDL